MLANREPALLHADPAAAIPVVVISRDRMFLEALPDNRGPLLGIQIVGRALDVADGRELIQRTAPQVVLLDGPSFCAGFRTLAENIAIRLGQTRVGVFADDLSDAQLELVAATGVLGVLSRQDSLQDLGAALRAVAGGELRVSPALQDRVAGDHRAGMFRVQRRSRLGHFTDRQLEVLIQLAEGRRVKDIADQMHLSEKAIESHKYRLMNRLGIHDRVELCRWAIREGLINA